MMQRLTRLAVPVLALVGLGVWAGAPPPTVRGVWERIEYGAPLELDDVFFTTPDEGWLMGAGTILHTSDAGEHWDVQWRDASGNRAGLRDFRFIDRSHGWVIRATGSDGQLLRTTDGRTWQPRGRVGANATDYAFVSDDVGVALVGNRILRTSDGGTSWSPAFDCITNADSAASRGVVACTPRRLHFVSPESGYVAAVLKNANGSAAHWVLVRTTNAGVSWQPFGTPNAGTPEALFFTSYDTGYARISDGFIYGTHDGGSSWQQLAPSAAVRVRFADPQVGWALGSPTLTYTVNGGVTWDTVPSGVKQPIIAFSFPRRDRAYAITKGGSLLRYEIVSSDSLRDTTASTVAMPAPDTVAPADVNKLASQLRAAANASTSDSACCAPHDETRHLSVDTVLAHFRLLAVKHRNLNLLLDGAESVRSVFERARQVSLRVQELRTTHGALARLDAFARLSMAVDSLSTSTSLTVQRVPRLTIHRRAKHVDIGTANGSAAPAATAAAPALAKTVQPPAKNKVSKNRPAPADAVKTDTSSLPPVHGKAPAASTSLQRIPRQRTTPERATAPNDTSAAAKAKSKDSSLTKDSTTGPRAARGKPMPPVKKPDSGMIRPKSRSDSAC